MWTLVFLVLAVAACPVQSQGGTYLTTYLGYDYFKVPVFGQMSSANVKAACDAAGYVTPCPGDGNCYHSSADCVTTGLTACTFSMNEVSQVLCGSDPRYCPAMDGVYSIYNDNWASGSACGVEGGRWCTIGNDYYDRFAFCARDVHVCSSAPCHNGATCQDGANSLTCRCAPGYIGLHCETNIDDCSSAFCQNGATCQDGVNSFTCQCAPGYTGTLCEIVPYSGGCLLFSFDAVSYPKASQECQTRGGHLVDVKEAELQRLIADSIPTGSDVSPWIGLKLSPGVMTYADGTSVSGQLQWLPNEPTTTCDLCAYLDSNNGHLAATASCMEQHHYVCQSDASPCQLNICNNGSCSTCFNGAYSFCDCLNGYEGDLCNIDIDECSSNPCQNGGVCSDGVNSYTCSCPAGYFGDHCEMDLDLCAQVACPFNWQCQDHGDHFICLAKSTRLAEPYLCSSASCPDGMYCREEGPASFSCRAG